MMKMDKKERKYLRKHIPENSLTIIFKFTTYNRLKEFLDDGKYHTLFGELDTLALKKGAKTERFINTSTI